MDKQVDLWREGKPPEIRHHRFRTGRTSHTVYPVKYLLVTGELTTGFQFYGPFDSVAAAGQWATVNLKPGTPHRVHNMSDVRGRE